LTDEQILASLDPGYYREDFDPVPNALENLSLDLCTAEEFAQDANLNDSIDNLYGFDSETSKEQTPQMGTKGKSTASQELETVMNDYETKVNIVEHKLHGLILDNYHEFVKGLSDVEQVSQGLQEGSKLCRAARRDLATSQREVAQDVFRTLLYERKRARILAILSIFKQVRKLSAIQEELEEYLARGELPEAAERYRDAQRTTLADQNVSHLKRVNAAAIPIAHISGYGEAVWGQIMRGLEQLARRFDERTLVQLIRPTLTLERTAGEISQALEDNFRSAIANVPWNVLKDFVSPEAYQAVELPPASAMSNIQDVKTSRAIRTLASKVENTKFSEAYLALLTELSKILYSAYRIPRMLVAIAARYEALANQLVEDARIAGGSTPELASKLNSLPPSPVAHFSQDQIDVLDEKTLALFKISDLIMDDPMAAPADPSSENPEGAGTMATSRERAMSCDTPRTPNTTAARTSAETVLRVLDEAQARNAFGFAIDALAAARAASARLIAVSSGFVQSQRLAWAEVQSLISAVLEGRKLTLAHISLEDFLQVLLSSYRLVIVGSRLTGGTATHSAAELARALFAKSRDFVKSFQREGIEVLRTNFTQDVWRPLPIRSDFALAHDVQELRFSADEGSHLSRHSAEGLAALVLGVAEIETPAAPSTTPAMVTTGTVKLNQGDDLETLQATAGAFAASILSPPASTANKSKAKKSTASKRSGQLSNDQDNLSKQLATSDSNSKQLATSDSNSQQRAPTDAASELIWKQFTRGRSPFESLARVLEETSPDAATAQNHPDAVPTLGSLDSLTVRDSKPLITRENPDSSANKLPEETTEAKPLTAAERLAQRIKAKEAQLRSERLGLLEATKAYSSQQRPHASAALSADGLLGVDAVGTPVRVVTTSAMTTVRYIGKYLSIVRDLAPLASEALKGLGELIDYFGYAIATVHCPNSDVFCEEHYRETQSATPSASSTSGNNSILSGTFLSSSPSTGSSTSSGAHQNDPNSMIAAAESKLASMDRTDPFKATYIPPLIPDTIPVSDGSLRPNPYVLPTSSGSVTSLHPKAGPITRHYPALAQLILSVKRRTEAGDFASGVFGEHSASYILAARALDRAQEEGKNKLSSFLRRSTNTSTSNANLLLPGGAESSASNDSFRLSGRLELAAASAGTDGDGVPANFVSITAPRIATTSLDAPHDQSAQLGAVLERITAVESFAFVASTLEALSPRFLALLPESHHSTFNALLARCRLVARDLRAFLIHTLPPMALPLTHVRDQILAANKWDAKSIATSASPYVDSIVAFFRSIEDKLHQLKLHGAELLPSFTVSCFKVNTLFVLSQAVVEALSRVKKCNTQGRAAMALDARVLAQELERIAKVGKPLPFWKLVIDYVSAYYLPDTDYLEWIRSKGGAYYTISQLNSLATLVHGSSMKKQRFKDYLTEIASAHAEGSSILEKRIEETKLELEQVESAKGETPGAPKTESKHPEGSDASLTESSESVEASRVLVVETSAQPEAGSPDTRSPSLSLLSQSPASPEEPESTITDLENTSQACEEKSPEHPALESELKNSEISPEPISVSEPLCASSAEQPDVVGETTKNEYPSHEESQDIQAVDEDLP